MSFIKELIVFLKQPALKSPVALNFKKSMIIFAKSISLYFVFIFICSILFIPLSFFDYLPQMPHRYLSDSLWIILYAPILEELCFRLPLRNFFKNIFFPLSLLFYYIFKTVFGVPITIALSILVVAIPYIPNVIERHEKKVNELISKYFPLLFYCIVLAFGFIHLTNFENLRIEHFLLSPIIVLFQLLMGLLLGFVRVQYRWGIFYSIAVHAGFNSVPILIKLLFSII